MWRSVTVSDIAL